MKQENSTDVDMQTEPTAEDNYPQVITPWYLLELLKPIIKDEVIAQCRFDRTGLRISFCNGQKFHLSVTEIK